MPLECEVSSIHNKQWPAVWCSSSKGETCTTVVRASTFRVSTRFSILQSKKIYFYALFRFYVPVLVQERSSAIFPHLSLPPDSSSQTLQKKKKRNKSKTLHKTQETTNKPSMQFTNGVSVLLRPTGLCER